jgi:hypothetical protein
VPYSLDTSGLIDAWVRYYPPDVFPAIWRLMDIAASDGTLLAIDEVARELERKDDGLFEWVKGHEAMVINIDAPIQTRLTQIMAKYGRLVDTRRNRSGCDPWVIALAQERRLTVVTAEKRTGSLTRPKIPDVCEDLGINCIDLIGLFRQLGWKL